MGILAVLRLIWLLLIACQTIVCGSHNSSLQLMWCEAAPLMIPQYFDFEQQGTDFWAYDRSSNTWRPIDFSKILHDRVRNEEMEKDEGIPPGVAAGFKDLHESSAESGDSSSHFQPYTGRVSIMRFSEVSVWITGHSGSIYERFWNGVQWVIIPHDLPSSAGYATSIYSVNRTMVALSEAGILYQLQIDSNGQLQWANSGPWQFSTSSSTGTDSSSIILRKSAVWSTDGSSLFFATADGWLAEFCSLHPIRWTNHGRPRGGDVAYVADAGNFRPGMLFTVSTSGDLYEYDAKAKPAWKKHIRSGSLIEGYPLAPSSGVVVHDLAGIRSFSLFLMTKNGLLVERRLAQAKWRWVLHTKPNVPLGVSLGPVFIDKDIKMTNISFFLTSERGAVYEYRLSFLHGNMRSTSMALQNGTWTNHFQPADAAVVVSVPGVVLNAGRIAFPLQDGRIGELHLDGLGGVRVSPVLRSPVGKKQHAGYVWSVFDAPESEGGNADYCSATLGPSNCLEGMKDASGSLDTESWEHSESFSGSREQSWPWNGTLASLYRVRTLQFGKSIFLVGRDGVAAERFFSGDVWLWLKHDSPASVRGIVAVYNGSVFMTDADGNLLIREWYDSMLQWVNCSAVEGGAQVLSGSPWDGMLGEARTVTLEDAQFFVAENGDLMEFFVALRKFTWRNCGHPPDTGTAAIVDQEVLRYRVVFVIGSNGKLYQFNRITRHWYAHQQPAPLTLSRVPGAVYRQSFQSTVGSLFMRSENGNLVEFHWNPIKGWMWSDHGFPAEGISVATAPGPCLENGHVFVIGSNGRVFGRQLVDGKWFWQDYGHPLSELDPGTHMNNDNAGPTSDTNNVFVIDDKSKTGSMEVYVSFDGECNTLIDSVRPVAFSKDTATFLLRDDRLAELKHVEEDGWQWVSIIDTPSSSCRSSYWTAAT